MNELRVSDPVSSEKDDVISHFFKEGTGLLAREFEGYKERPGQVALARKISEAIEKGRHVIGEGPTGTGKSLAYAVPAIFGTKDEEECVVIVTANIALQEQLVRKDLPLLAKILPFKFTFSLLKGIQNYLCRDAYETEQMKAGMFADHDWKQIQTWAATTLTGDKSELPFEPGKTWLKISSSSDECKRGRCAYADNCFGRTAMMDARKADVIVTNYHMLFAHYKVQKMTMGVVNLIPPHKVLILDESHKMADIARDFFGENISYFSVTKAAQKLRDKSTGRDQGFHTLGVPKSECDKLERICDSFFQRLTKFMRGRAYSRRLRIQNSVDWQGICEEISKYSASAKGATKRLREAVAPLQDIPMSDLTKQEKTLVNRAADVENARRRLKEISDLIHDAMLLEKSDQLVYFLEEDRKQERAVLKSKLIHPGATLRSFMWDTTPTVVATSATLSTANSFNWISKEIGAPKDRTDTIQVESPFSHEKALLIVPDEKFIPNIKDERLEFEMRLPKAIEEILHKSKGRALCLFTSYNNMKATAEHLQRKDLPWDIFVQGQAPRTKLVDDFRNNEHSVLLGVESFWAGVDVPGSSLSCVIIDKLPFPNPSDPVLDALDELGANVFFEHSVPRAQVQLKQGVGRLIRGINDVGVVVVLDRRICESRYGAGFVQSLPPMLKTRDINAVEEFLR